MKIDCLGHKNFLCELFTLIGGLNLDHTLRIAIEVPNTKGYDFTKVYYPGKS